LESRLKLQGGEANDEASVGSIFLLPLHIHSDSVLMIYILEFRTLLLDFRLAVFEYLPVTTA
jgi:hypothetical protein